MFRASNFDKLLDKATSNLRLEPDWPTILQISDLIRQGDVNSKYALAAIKKKISHTNPHVAMFGLMVLESCVKNCGGLVHDEIGTKAYMEQVREMIKTSPHTNIKNKLLELIQAWAYAFRNSPKYRAVQDTVNIMKTEGYTFPVLKESDAMFSADTAPEWADGDCCHRCRVQFGMVQRKHHCRACGQVFCSQCSSKTCTLPKFGIEKDVRVCDSCYDKQATKPVQSKSADELPPEYLRSTLAQQNQLPPARKSEDELREEEEFQLALALSKSEAESKGSQYRGSLNNNYMDTCKSQSSAIIQNSINIQNREDPELAHYLDRSYWEKKQETSDNAEVVNVIHSNNTQHNLEPENELDDFMAALKSQVEIFVNRMKSNSSRGRSISNDSSVQTLFMNITAMHSRLLRYIHQQDDQRVFYEGLQDKLTQVKDARAALDALREEHKERLRREAEMAERQRQIQMAQKLEIMRQKKQEYLQYQRQLALQRIQDQEMELHMRQEQQKLHYRLNTYSGIPYMQPTPNSGMQGSYESGSMIPMNVPAAGQFGSHFPPAPYAPHYAQGPSAFSIPQGQGQHDMMINQMPYVSIPPGHVPPPMMQEQVSFPAHIQQPIYSGGQGVPPIRPITHVEQEPHGMTGPTGTTVIRPIGRQTPPLSSPSGSSENSLSNRGQQPLPSAPSASSTPQPEEKEQVAELISFD